MRLSDLNRAKAVVLKLTKLIHPAFAPAHRPTNSVKIASAIALHADALCHCISVGDNLLTAFSSLVTYFQGFQNFEKVNNYEVSPL